MRTRRIGTAAAIVAAAVAWLWLAPKPLGGSARYVAVSGASMAPTLRAGDLVALRETAPYEVGDIVAYRSPEAGAVYVHRIVAASEGRFSLRGDANDWVDAHRPAPSEILGSVWARVPKAGAMLSGLRRPVAVGPIAAAGLGILAYRRRGRGRMRRALSAASPALLGGGAVAVLGASLLTAGFVARPAAAPARSIEARISYSGDARGSIAYPTGRVDTGEPIYLALVDEVEVALDVVGPEQRRSVTLTATLRDDDGWQRPFSLSDVTLADGSGRVSGRLDMADLRDTIASLEAETAISRPQFRLEISARIAPGTGDGAFEPRATFSVDRMRMRPETSEGDPFAHVSAPAAATAPARVLGVPAPAARALGLTLAVLGAWFAFASVHRRAARAGSLAGVRIVDVGAVPHRAGSVTVNRVDDLAAMVMADGSMLFRSARDGAVEYWAVIGGTTFRADADEPVLRRPA